MITIIMKLYIFRHHIAIIYRDAKPTNHRYLESETLIQSSIGP